MYEKAKIAAADDVFGPPIRAAIFATTRWSVVIEAARNCDAQANTALDSLCRTYWYPLYAYVRRRGYDEHQAADLTQGFFACLLQRQALQSVSREKGKFRSFLLASLNYFLADARAFALAQKRGGGKQIISFDAQEAEDRYRSEPVDRLSPDRIFERRWALAMLQEVLHRVEHEFVAAGKEKLFRRLRPFLVEGAESGTYADAARDLDMTPEAVKKAVQRLRRRWCDLFREEVAHTVGSPQEVDDELRYLCSVIRGE